MSWNNPTISLRRAIFIWSVDGFRLWANRFLDEFLATLYCTFIKISIQQNCQIDTRKRKKYTKPSFISSWFVALELSIEINSIQQRSTARGIELQERRVSFILLLRLSRQQLTKQKSFLAFYFESSNISDWSATEILPCFPDYRIWLVNWTEKVESCFLLLLFSRNN